MKHLFLYTLTFCIIQLITQTLTPAALMRAEGTAITFGKSLIMPWKSTRAWDNRINIFTTALAGLANVCDWAQPLQSRASFLEAQKNIAQRGLVLFYNTIWLVKKLIACNEMYRVGSRFHWESQNPIHNPFEYLVSLLKIITIFGDRVAEAEHLERASRLTFGEQSVWKSVQSD